jgi:hypothetical protein
MIKHQRNRNRIIRQKKSRRIRPIKIVLANMNMSHTDTKWHSGFQICYWTTVENAARIHLNHREKWCSYQYY